MKLLRAIIFAYLYLPYGIQKLSRTGAFGNQGAVYVPLPVPADGNGLKNALIRHYIKQYHDASCSVASVVTVVNALRSGDSDQPRPITQRDILDRVRIGHWKERMSNGGHNGRRGLPLDLLGKIVTGSLAAYDIPHAAVETVHTSTRAGNPEKIKAQLYRRLADFETNGTGIIIAHFNQGAYVPTLGIPHISPVGGFDPRTGQVMILDVDASQPGPYQVDFRTFYKGLACTYNPVFRHYGYKNGGYVFVKL